MPRAAWPPYQTLRPLIHAHVGRPAIIMGGGPSLPEAIARAPMGVYFSANDHGCRFFQNTPYGALAVNYIVACDKIEKRVRPFGLPIIGRQMWSDYRLLFMPGPSSGMAAAWCARFMGCAPILLAGMDLYSGGTYYDDAKGVSSGKNVGSSIHLDRWLKMIRQYPAQYRLLGGDKRLEYFMGAYDPQEKSAPPVAREKLLSELRGECVKLKRDCPISLRAFPAGSELELNMAEAAKLLKTGVAQRCAVRA